MIDRKITYPEIESLLEIVADKYDYDFRNYAPPTLLRRITLFLEQNKLRSANELIIRIKTDKSVFEALFAKLTICVTEMFRDPEIYHTLRTNVLPYLATYPKINIWHAGCATGEEAYSMAILLTEYGLYERTQIYATDISNNALASAKEGVFSSESMELYEINYKKAGGQNSVHDYFNTKHNMLVVNPSLKKNILFSNHNLITDSVFAKMHLILMRNVLIYFNRPLQNRVLELADSSLVKKGFLCLGTKETLSFSDIISRYQEVDRKNRIYQKTPTKFHGTQHTTKP